MSIDKTIPKTNEIAFKWFNNYSGITIKTPSKTLVIDPVDVKTKTFSTVDAILITHEQYDHLDSPLVRKLQRETQCQVLADPTSSTRLANSITNGNLQMMEPGTEVSIDKVTIRAEVCKHQVATTPVTYLVTSEDDVKIYHTADSMPFPEMKEIGKEHKPDVAFCSVGIAPGTSPETAVEIVKLVKPKVASPYHSASKTDLKTFCGILKKEQPRITCLLAERGNVYIVGKERRK